MSFFIHLFIFLSLLTFFFQIDRLEPSFTDSVFRFRDSVIPCFSPAGRYWLRTRSLFPTGLQWRKTTDSVLSGFLVVLLSARLELNLDTPEEAALPHTNYRVPSIASHFSNSCIAAITHSEYADPASLLPFSSLLRDHVTANSQLKLQVGNEDLTIPLPFQAKRRKITGIDRWLDAFAVYSSVLLSSYPSRGGGPLRLPASDT